jgi:hypothetical protein
MTTTQDATPYSCLDHPELMARLIRCQNEDRNANQDIVTFAGYCQSREALERHVERYEAYSRAERNTAAGV